MKAFSPAGPAVKAFFGYGAKTFGNPQGHTSGDGAVGASTSNGTNPNILPPPPTPVPGPPISALSVDITGDHISAGNSIGVLLSTLLGANLAAWQAGVYNVLNLQGAGVPARGYWVISGDGMQAAQSGPGFAGLVLDTFPANAVTINLDQTLVRVYGGGATGGNQASNGAGGAGGDAIQIDNSAGAVNLNITLGTQGKLFGGGGGGRWGSMALGGAGGGGGAAGWIAGRGSDGGSNGGVYDAANGGADNPNVLGGLGGNVNSGNGGNLGAAGTGGNGVNGAGGFAVSRNSTGATVVADGSALNLRGIVQ